MPTYYIFRHGETFATKGKTGYGVRVFSAPILPDCIPTLEKMGKYLKKIDSDYCVSSQILRCRQTTEIITSITEKDFVRDERLNEYFLETFKHFTKRVENFIHETEDKKYKRVFVCTHGAVIAVLRGFLVKKAIQPQDLFIYPDPGVLTIVNKTNLEEINFN